jgi:hypothetical protein
MGYAANLVVIGEDGQVRIGRAPYTGYKMDLHLLGGPAKAATWTFRRGPYDPPDDYLLHRGMCTATILIDWPARLVLLFVDEGPTASPAHRATAFAMLREAWPGWTVRWAVDGQVEICRHLGQDPETVREYLPQAPCEPFRLEPDEADAYADNPDPDMCLVTIDETGTAPACYAVLATEWHPVGLGPALLGEFIPEYDVGPWHGHAMAGIHVDVARRRIAWWGLYPASHPMPGEAELRWPGWTVDFHGDVWDEHVRLARGVFMPPSHDPPGAYAAILEDLAEMGCPSVPWSQATSTP